MRLGITVLFESSKCSSVNSDAEDDEWSSRNGVLVARFTARSRGPDNVNGGCGVWARQPYESFIMSLGRMSFRLGAIADRLAAAYDGRLRGHLVYACTLLVLVLHSGPYKTRKFVTVKSWPISTIFITENQCQNNAYVYLLITLTASG